MNPASCNDIIDELTSIRNKAIGMSKSDILLTLDMAISHYAELQRQDFLKN